MSKDVLANSSDSSGGQVILNCPPTKQISPSKKWCFTYNNYSDETISSIVPIFESECKCGIIGKEEGALGTPHLQGYVEFLTKVRPKNMFPLQIHWEKARANRQDNITYCSKEGHVIWSKGECIPERPIKLINPTKWWQKKILKMIDNEPDDRTVNWFWSEAGKIGKTQFQKYLTVKHNAITLGYTNADNIKHGIMEYRNKNGRCPEIICINIPRGVEAQYISYIAFESIKDMYFFSGKYETGMVCGPPPHLFIFSNMEPLSYKLSEDRWNIICIDESTKDSGVDKYFKNFKLIES